MPSLRVIAAFFWVSVLSACKPACTELGCGNLDGVQVTFESFPGVAAQEHFEITDGDLSVRCDPRLRLCVLPSRYPPTITARHFRGATILAERTVGVRYETVRPNGPECGGSCKLGTASIAW